MSALQKGEKVLITGGTGWIGSHIAHEALAAGLKIKLAIRDESKAKTLIESLEKIHGTGHIETVIVKDFSAEGAYDDAVKGVQGIVHAASDVSFGNDKENILSSVLKAYNSILDAASSQKSIRRFVLTSSSVAIAGPNATSEVKHINASNWYDEAVEAVNKQSSPDGGTIYAASKVLSERAAWNYQKKHNPSFVITSINPNLNLGKPVPGTPCFSTGQWLMDFADGKESPMNTIGPQHHVDVEDVAKLHVIALIREDVKNERILAYGTSFSLNMVIDAIKKYKPDAKVYDKKDEWNVYDNTVVDVSRANELLKDQGGLKNMDYSIQRQLQA